MATDPCPERPRSDADLDFTPQPMVRWFYPLELVRTGTEAVLSSLFGAYADWREVQALQARDRAPDGRGDASDILQTITPEGGGPTEWYDLSDADERWIDYTADLGDGFDSTYTVARLLADRRLDVDDHETERGDLLVMGGDQVYPTASRTMYQDRLVGPYRAALPCVTDEAPPSLFAVPGNHDWYDGLTSFLRLFTQNRWIGGWRTRQRRSYFAIKLPHDWWLWGIDVQLESDIDEPQLNYFKSIASADSIMPPGSKVVLCTAEPTWVYSETDGPEAYQNLGYFRDKVISANDHELAVGLAGDLHNYARYADDDTNQQRFIAGGGGAYLYPTHDLPEALDLTTPDGDRSHLRLQQSRADGTEESLFPSRQESRRLTWGALLLPFKNRTFGAVVAALYLLFAWLLESSTVVTAFADAGAAPFQSLLERMTDLGFWAGVGATIEVLKHPPRAVVLVLGLWGGLSAFADLRSWPRKIGVGVVHTSAHLLLAVALMWGFASLNVDVLGMTADSLGHALFFSAEMLLVGGLLGGTLIGLYLVLANRGLGIHTNEVFSCQHIPHYKHVVRLHVDPDGDLTIYPLGVPTVERNWSLHPDGRPQEPWFEGTGELADRVELIEPPVSVDGSHRHAAPENRPRQANYSPEREGHATGS